MRAPEGGQETGRDRQRRYRIRQADRARAGRAAPEMADSAPVDIAPVETVSSAAGGADDEETVTDHTSGLPRRRLSAVFRAQSRRESPLRCVGCGRMCTHVVVHDP